MEEKNTIQKNSYEYWNKAFGRLPRNEIITDDWLDSFAKEIEECQTPIIDLGCGDGNNTLYLLKKGKKVIPCDLTENAVRQIQLNFPEIERTEQFDMLEGLPFEDGFTDMVIADLCLHYFTEEDTLHILEDIKRILKPGGILFARVNSVRDTNHGAGEGLEVERHLFLTKDNRYKRFFDKEDIELFFGAWNIQYLGEETMDRYKEDKVLWRIAARKGKTE